MADRLLAVLLTLAVAATVGFGLCKLHDSLAGAPWEEVSPPPEPPKAVDPIMIPPPPKPTQFKFFTGSKAPAHEARRSVPLEKVRKKTPRKKKARKKTVHRKLRKGRRFIKLKRPQLQKIRSGFVDDVRTSSVGSGARMDGALPEGGASEGAQTAGYEETAAPPASVPSSPRPRRRPMRSLNRSGVVPPGQKPSAAPQEEYIEYDEEQPIE